MAFEPEKHLISLRSGGKPDYLETKWRITWFRQQHPRGCISTEILTYEPMAVKATVYDGEGAVLATAHAGADASKGNVVWKGRSLEKAETAAVGRALAMAGFGTQFVGQDLDDGIADSPAASSSDDNDEQPDESDNLANRDTAADFFRATRALGYPDNEVVAALGVTKVSQYKHGRKKAWEVVKWAMVYKATAPHWNARKHFDNWLAQQYPDGTVGLDADELIAAIEADRVAQGKEAKAQNVVTGAFN